MSITAEDDVLSSVELYGRVNRQIINDDGSTIDVPLSAYAPPVLNEAIGALNSYMNELFKQHNQTTQFLTYANQLWKLESYIASKLKSDYMSTASGQSAMSTTIYVVRQRYMDKVSKIYYNTWVAMVLRRTLLCILVAATLVSLNASGGLGNVPFMILMTALGIYYLWWFYYQIDQNARRDPTDPSVFKWTYSNSTNSTANSCNNNASNGANNQLPSYPPP